MELMYLPIIPTRGIVVFPGTHVTFDVGRKESKKAVDESMGTNKTIFVTAQKTVQKEEFNADEVYQTGTIAKIEQILKLPNGLTRIVVRGVKRARIERIADNEPNMHVMAEELETKGIEGYKKDAYIRLLREEYKKYFAANHRMNAEDYMRIISLPDLEELCDVITSEMSFDINIKQMLLEETDLASRIEVLIVNMQSEIEIIQLEHEIGTKVKKNIDKNQREYYLREQMKVIASELGTTDVESEIEDYRKKIKSLDTKQEIKDKLTREVDRFSKMNTGSSESAVIRTYLDTVLDLPWNKFTAENLDIDNAQKILDEDHYGLEKIKERITEYLAVKILKKGTGQILCLSGPPGVGKTSIAKSVARALNRKFVRISLGGIHDEADIRGHRKTYVGAMPGRIMEAVARAGSSNALILLDEIDKMGVDYNGDPSAALLEVLDAEQNMAFRDHYIEVPFDLSKIMFIATANTCQTLSAPLLDRLEIIELSGYTTEEKLHIGQKYLLPRAISSSGLEKKNVMMSEEVMRDIIEYYTREAGVRHLERELTAISRKAAKKILVENKKRVRVTKNNLSGYLGQKRYSFEAANKEDEIGIVRGLAWTATGGDTLSIEVNVMDGTGKTELTGKLGDVMKESAVAAISYIRSRASELKIDGKFYKNKDIHIHVPEGAVPKDGPSAGITIATAVASALTGRPVRHDIAMTGEVTIRGRVLPIGGLKEKSLAAYRAGIDTVIIPAENKKDIDDIPENIREKITFIPVTGMDDVLGTALVE